MPGSLPVEVLDEFQKARKQARITFRQTVIRDATFEKDTVRSGRTPVFSARNALFWPPDSARERPGGRFVDRLIEDFGLPCNPCGYPIVGKDLQWGKNIYVSGPLAELQIGPCARNIVGARNAGRQLLASLVLKVSLHPPCS